MIGSAAITAAQPNLANTFKILPEQSFGAPFDEISAYTGMRDLDAWRSEARRSCTATSSA